MHNNGTVSRQAYQGESPYWIFGEGPKVELVTNGVDSLIKRTDSRFLGKPNYKINTNREDPSKWNEAVSELNEAKAQTAKKLGPILNKFLIELNNK